VSASPGAVPGLPEVGIAEAPATLGAVFREGQALFRRAGLPTPDLDARWLLAFAAGCEPAEIVLRAGDALDAAATARARALFERRLLGEPVDRIIGTREFWGMPFRLSAATLSPRPDTESVVEAALACLPEDGARANVLDLGTGTGAILVALLRERRRAFGVGLDRSFEAASTARDNAALNGVADRAAFVVGDWGQALAGGFDLVVSNPPYIADAAIAALEGTVRDHDPHLALRGGGDGLDAYRAILSQAPALLARGGALVLELGHGQEAAVAGLAVSAGLAPGGRARHDLGGVPRALVLRAV
jgi:release factor glutamine methyltransferase